MSDGLEVTRSRSRWFAVAVVAIATAWPSAAVAQRGGGHGMAGGGMGHDAAHDADMQVFHELFDARDRIVRNVTMRPDGVDTLTESNDPAVARAIQVHVVAMSARVKEGRPIHQRDPLFRAVFAHADRIVMAYEMTPKGVRVTETSDDPYVVKLVQQHAQVVSDFLSNGHAEMMKDHPVPGR